MIAILQITSGVFLAYAIYLIKKWWSESGLGETLNYKIFACHVAAFLLYLVSIVIFQIFESIYFYEKNEVDALLNYYRADIFCNVCSFIE